MNGRLNGPSHSNLAARCEQSCTTVNPVVELTSLSSVSAMMSRDSSTNAWAASSPDWPFFNASRLDCIAVKVLFCGRSVGKERFCAGVTHGCRKVHLELFVSLQAVLFPGLVLEAGHKVGP